MRLAIVIFLISGLLSLNGCVQKAEAYKHELSTINDKPILLSRPDVSYKGEMRLPIVKLREGTKSDLLVSCGIPFAQGELFSDKDIKFFDGKENEIPIATKVLARWIQDGSIRAILVQFNFTILHKYEYVTFKWGEPRMGNDLTIAELTPEMPEAIILLPKEWLCRSRIIGDQVPVERDKFTGQLVLGYDKNMEQSFQKVKDVVWSDDTREDNYYDTAYVFYQLYARTGEDDYFKAARKEAVHYRDSEIIQEGPERGKNTKYEQTRYVFVQAMISDYLFTGDIKSLETARFMVDYLIKTFPPEKAYLPKITKRFWTEREAAFPFLGVITYYELTGDQRYFEIAKEYMGNLYKTQRAWPNRGGFIHNLYFSSGEVGAKITEYGGCPFMTGLLLEPIIKYHQLTNSNVARDSIFMAVDWLVKETLAPDGKSFIYLTSKNYLGKGLPDLNMLIVHAFGYAYKISDYKRKDYLDLGKKIFDGGVESGFFNGRKGFNQNYRSSGHFLAYVSGEGK